MFLIQRMFVDYKFFAPPTLRHWTENPAQAVQYADKQIAAEQADRLPYVVDIIPAPNGSEGPHR
jgi:hypothetical protein